MVRFTGNKKGKGGTQPLMKNTVKSSNGKENVEACLWMGNNGKANLSMKSNSGNIPPIDGNNGRAHF